MKREERERRRKDARGQSLSHTASSGVRSKERYIRMVWEGRIFMLT